MLTEVKLERFKAAFLPGPITLRPFNVVIGRNGSGESTLVEALQWVDQTIRRDAREACDRYYGSRDIINLRSQASVPYFALTFFWSLQHLPPHRLRNTSESRTGTAPRSSQGEELATVRESGHKRTTYITSSGGVRRVDLPGSGQSILRT